MHMQSSASDETAAFSVPQTLLDECLEPYKPHCRYLHSARVSYAPVPGNRFGRLVSHGTFGIPESCYIDDTGHFNAVEFNICYNQLMYVALGAGVSYRLLPELSEWSLDEYHQRRLSNFIIADLASQFTKPMSARAFEGETVIEKTTIRGGNVFWKTSVRFKDDHGGRSKGRVLIAALNKTARASAH